MNTGKSDKNLDELIYGALGRERATFDFGKWKETHKKEIDIFKSQAVNRQTSQPVQPLNIWRIIVRSKISITAAATIILAFGLFGIFTNVTKSAYAIEQTIQAYEGLRYVHIKDFMDGEDEPREFWVELDEQEQVKRFRASIPAWAEREGPMAGVWNEGKLQIWSNKNNVPMTKNADSLGLEMLNIVKGCDPRSVVKMLHQLETKGKVEIAISKPGLKSDSIVITAKFLSQNSDFKQMVLYVDQNTLLVTRATINKLENGHQHSWEFSDYNMVIDESFFMPIAFDENFFISTATFMKNINAKLASLDINKSAVTDVIAVLGEPWAYKRRGKYLERNNLPEAYAMAYPGGFTVSIYKNQVMQWGCQQTSEYETPGYRFSDSITVGTPLDAVFEKLGSPAKIVEGIGGENNKIMYEDNIIYANMNINERKGFCFSRYDSDGKEVTVYFDDNVLYKDLMQTKGYCFYGTVSNGKRIRFSFINNKVIAIYEYRTEPLKTTKP